MLEGQPYAEMLRTIKDVVEEKTGCGHIRLRFAVGGSKSDAKEMVPYYGLGEYFHHQVKSAGPFDPGIPIETEIGTLYGLRNIYDAD